MLNKPEQWDNFYKNLPEYKLSTSSDFSRWVSGKILQDLQQTPNQKSKKLIDIGCGNGRDSYSFGILSETLNLKDITCIDSSTVACEKTITRIQNNTNFSCLVVNAEAQNYSLISEQDIYYCRFFLHTITEEDFHSLMSKLRSGAMFFSETRILTEESPKNTKEKKRRILSEFDHLSEVSQYLYIVDKKIGYFSPIKNDNPLLCRIYGIVK